MRSHLVVVGDEAVDVSLELDKRLSPGLLNFFTV
jgi:hypothetical protein